MTNFDAEFFKTTVFLPTTDFPMRGDLPVREPEILKRWQAMDLYARLREKKGRKVWTLHDGPPYANGNIHIGHAVNKILKDVINRTMQMSGFDADYVPGWDCHGLPIEWKIEEKYREAGKDKDAVPILEFRKECRDFAQHWVNVQSDEFQRLGVVGDWKDPYLTMKLPAEAQIAREIHKFLMNGGLYRGVKPVLWSVVEKTALAEAEVEYHEHKSITIWVKFPIIKASTPEIDGASIVIWTTTPWTMPSNRAIAAGANMDYALYTVDAVKEGSRAKVGEKLLLNPKLSADVKEKSGIESWTEGKHFKGSDIKGTVTSHPLHGKGYDFDVPVLNGDFVTDEAGTGFVHIAPSHGQDDYILYMSLFGAKDIPDNVDDGGKFRDHVPLFAGLSIFEEKGGKFEFGPGNFGPLKAIDEAGGLLAKGSIRHEYPHSWRSKAPLIFRTTPQWFISMQTNDLRANALKAIADTDWYPAAGENRIRAMIEQRPDWCISRQRAWGVPIAIFVDKKSGQPLQDQDVCDRIATIFETEGSDAWYKRDKQEFLGNKYKADDFDQIFDIVDVWFESGSTHQFVLAPRGLPWPADLYLEGSDQHRGWFHSSLLESCGTTGRAPYNAVLTHGFVLDEKGMKMSKSMGNVTAPQTVMQEYGADILRLWTITSNYSEDIRVGKEILKTSADMYRRIRNTFRYLLGAIDGFTKDQAVDLTNIKDLPELERYMLHQLATLDQNVKKAITDYDFGEMAQLVYTFCNSDLSAFYFDVRKDRLYCDRPDMPERRAYLTVMTYIFEALATYLAPILSFTADEAWQYRPRGLFRNDADSVHLVDFFEAHKSWIDPQLAQRWSEILAVRKVVNGVLEVERQNGVIKSALDADIAVTVPSQKLADVDWAEVCITSKASVQVGDTAGATVKKVDGVKCERCWKYFPENEMDPEFGGKISKRDGDAVRFFQQLNSKAA